MVISSSLPSMPPYYSNNQSTIQKTPLDNKIESANADLQQHFVNILSKQSNQNAETIADYVIAITMEVNPYHLIQVQSDYNTLSCFKLS